MQRLITLWLLLFLLQLAAPLGVFASVPAPALSWVREQGAESCISSIELARRVEALLGRLIFVSASDAELVVEGYVRPNNDAEGFTARLVVSDSSGKTLGSRDLTTGLPDCQTLDEALALVIAVTLYPKSGLAGSSMLPPESASLLDALFATEPTEPDPNLLDLEISSKTSNEPTRVKENESASPPSEKSESEFRSSPPETGKTVAIGASGVAGTGLLPGLNVGVGALFRLILPDVWPIEVSGIFWFPNQDALNESENETRKFEVVHGGVSICPLNWKWQALSSTGCAGVQFGFISAETVGLFFDDPTTKALINIDLSAAMEIEIFRYFFPRLGIRASFPALQHNFRYRDHDGVARELFNMSQVGLIAEMGLNLKF